MTVENISWSISTKECCRPRRGLNQRPPSLQSDGASNWATKAGKDEAVKLIISSTIVSLLFPESTEQNRSRRQFYLFIIFFSEKNNMALNHLPGRQVTKISSKIKYYIKYQVRLQSIIITHMKCHNQYSKVLWQYCLLLVISENKTRHFTCLTFTFHVFTMKCQTTKCHIKCQVRILYVIIHKKWHMKCQIRKQCFIIIS